MSRFAPALLLLLLLAGCGGDPADEVRAGVAELTSAANARDASRVREEADALVDLVEAQRSRDEIPQAQAERLLALAQSVRNGADVIDEDLLARRRAEAEAEAAKQQLEEERKEAEEAEEAEDGGKGKGGDKDDDEEKDD